MLVVFYGFISKDICVFLTQASSRVSRVIPLWLITLASKELSRFLVTSNDLPAEGGTMEGGRMVPFFAKW